MQLKDQVLLYINRPTKQGRVFIEDEFTKVKTTNLPDGSTYQMTLLDKLNGVKWHVQSDPADRVKIVKHDVLHGQIDHPDTMRHDIENVSHTISNIVLRGDLLIGDVNILDTWKGAELANLIESNNDLIVFRPRYSASVNGLNQIIKLDIITFDAILKSDEAF